MYLHLRSNREGEIEAEVKNSGELKFSSLGGPSSQMSDHPFAVFKISEFSGIDCIETDDLYSELIRRCGNSYLLNRLEIDLTNEELVRMLTERLK